MGTMAARCAMEILSARRQRKIATDGRINTSLVFMAASRVANRLPQMPESPISNKNSGTAWPEKPPIWISRGAR